MLSRTNIISAIVGLVIITLIGNGLVILGMDNLMVEGC